MSRQESGFSSYPDWASSFRNLCKREKVVVASELLLLQQQNYYYKQEQILPCPCCTLLLLDTTSNTIKHYVLCFMLLASKRLFGSTHIMGYAVDIAAGDYVRV